MRQACRSAKVYRNALAKVLNKATDDLVAAFDKHADDLKELNQKSYGKRKVSKNAEDPRSRVTKKDEGIIWTPTTLLAEKKRNLSEEESRSDEKHTTVAPAHDPAQIREFVSLQGQVAKREAELSCAYDDLRVAYNDFKARMDRGDRQGTKTARENLENIRSVVSVRREFLWEAWEELDKVRPEAKWAK